VFDDDAWRDADEPVNTGPHLMFFKRPTFSRVLKFACLVSTLVSVGFCSVNHLKEPPETSLDAVNSLACRITFHTCKTFFFFCCQLFTEQVPFIFYPSCSKTQLFE
jgi:hypothetical protein